MAYMRPFMVILELNDGTEGDTETRGKPACLHCVHVAAIYGVKKVSLCRVG
jgi:hypothetical protein